MVEFQQPELARNIASVGDTEDGDTMGGDTMGGRVTRRGMVASNIKAIGAIAASAIVAKLLAPKKASALVPSCFLRGTKIQTIVGERNIEDLAIGDLLPTVFRGALPIQWITRYRRKKDDPSKPWITDVQPVRIKGSALAPDVPHTDLYVTSRHALFIDGVLIPAGNLLNGTTISLCAADECEELEFFHIKLETHDIIYAEGAPCETLLRVEETAMNFAGYLRKYGPSSGDEVRCAPLFFGSARSKIKSRVRSLMSPWLGQEKFDIICDRLEARANIERN